MTNILILGSGSAEHAIAKALTNKHQNVNIYSIGQWINPGLAAIGKTNIIDVNDPELIVQYATGNNIDIAIGATKFHKQLSDAGIYVFSEPIDQLDDYIYVRRIVDDNYNPQYTVLYTAEYTFGQLKEIITEYKQVKLPGTEKIFTATDLPVIDRICRNFIRNDGCVLIEQYESGQQFSVTVLSDGQHVAVGPITIIDQAQNCVCYANNRAPFLNDNDLNIVQQLSKQLATSFATFKGVLNINFNHNCHGIKLVDYDNGFKSLQTINTLELLQADLLEVIECIKNGQIDKLSVVWSTDAMISSYIHDSGDGNLIRLPFTNNIIYNKITKQGNSTVYKQMGSESFVFWSRAKKLSSAYTRLCVLLALLPEQSCHYHDVNKI